MTCSANDIEIFCRSYDGDAEWLERSLPTWIEHKPKEMRITLCGIPRQCQRILEIARKHKCKFVADIAADSIPNGYVNQQYSKMCAGNVCYAPYILFLDSDVFAVDDIYPDMFFKADKPIWLYSEWDVVGDAICWKQITDEIVGKTPPHEFMRRLPMLVKRDTLSQMADYLRAVHKKPLLQLFKDIKHISEFNAMGTYAWFNHHDEYFWIDAQNEPYDPIPFKQFWSWGNMQEQLREWEDGR